MLANLVGGVARAGLDQPLAKSQPHLPNRGLGVDANVPSRTHTAQGVQLAFLDLLHDGVVLARSNDALLLASFAKKDPELLEVKSLCATT